MKRNHFYFIYLFTCFSISSFLKSCESDDPQTPQQSESKPQDDSQTPQQPEPQDDPQIPQQSESKPQDDSQTPQQPEPHQDDPQTPQDDSQMPQQSQPHQDDPQTPQDDSQMPQQSQPSSGKKVELTSNLSFEEIQSFIDELETYKKEHLSNEYPSYFYRILDFHNFYTWKKGDRFLEKNENNFFNEISTYRHHSIGVEAKKISKTVTQSLIETLEKEIQIATEENRSPNIDIFKISQVEGIAKAKKFDSLLSQVNFLNPKELEYKILKEYMGLIRHPALIEIIEDNEQSLKAIKKTNIELIEMVYNFFIDAIIFKLHKIDPDPTIINDVEEEITTDTKRLNILSSAFINTTIKDTIELIKKLPQQ